MRASIVIHVGQVKGLERNLTTADAADPEVELEEAAETRLDLFLTVDNNDGYCTAVASMKCRDSAVPDRRGRLSRQHLLRTHGD